MTDEATPVRESGESGQETVGDKVKAIEKLLDLIDTSSPGVADLELTDAAREAEPELRALLKRYQECHEKAHGGMAT